MKTICIDPLIEKIAACVARHRLASGSYSRYTFGEGKDLGRNEYGCADAANILYTIGRFPKDPAERAEWVRNLQEMQNPETGFFEEATHHPIHTTAHCSAALELFDASPLYRVEALKGILEKEELYRFLEEEVHWWDNPWRESHKGAGILPSLANTDMIDLEWKNWYFDWLWAHSDPETGFFWSGAPKETPLKRMMAGGFHYLFNHEAERRPFRYPEKIIDSCLLILSDYPKYDLLKGCNFIEIDVVYCLTRAMRQSPHRFEEGKAALAKFAESFLAMMNAIDEKNDPKFDDLHCLFGAVCCLAELQSALPGKILTSRPLRLVLDRRPFI